MRAAVWKLRSIKEVVGGWGGRQRGHKNGREMSGQKQRGEEEAHKRVWRKRTRRERKFRQNKSRVSMCLYCVYPHNDAQKLKGLRNKVKRK